MASTAYAYDLHDELAVMPLRQSSRSVTPAPTRSNAENITWHEQQLERLFTAFIGEEAPAPAVDRLPLMVRIGVVVGGACLGWSVPIALAWTLIR